jgi:hypothetical protein
MEPTSASSIWFRSLAQDTKSPLTGGARAYVRRASLGHALGHARSLGWDHWNLSFSGFPRGGDTGAILRELDDNSLYVVHTQLVPAMELLATARAGIQQSEHLEGDGAAIFALACGLGCEGIVSKHRAHPYRSGPSKVWLKIKNPVASGVTRFEERS